MEQIQRHGRVREIAKGRKKLHTETKTKIRIQIHTQLWIRMPKQSENKKDGGWTSDHKFTVCRFLLQKRQAGPPPTSYLLTPYTPFHPSQPFLSFTQFNIFYIPFFLTLPFFYSIQYISFSILPNPNPSFLLSNSIYIIFHPS